MANIFMCFVMFVVVAAHKHHPKFPKQEDYSVPLMRIKGDYGKVSCMDNDKSRERDNLIEQSKCGEPKEVFVHLDPSVAHEQVSPSAIWVKRCVGLCEYDNAGTCIPTATITRHIPIRVYNAKTDKETCATYPVEEHVRCGCCALSAQDCPHPRVFNPRKCSCQCPDMEERRNCLKKRNQNKKWNRSKCMCEERRKIK